MVKVPPLGLFTTLSCATGGVQDSDPDAEAVNPSAAVAFAAGLDWDWQAPAGVVAGLETTIVTEACGAIVPRLQLKLLLLTPLIVQVPAGVAVAVAHVMPPAVGSVSVNWTLVADWLPSAAGLVTVIVKLA